MTDTVRAKPTISRRRDFLELLATSYALASAVWLLSAAGGALLPYFGSTAMVVAKVLGFVAACAWFCFFIVLNLRHAPAWIELGLTLRGFAWQLMFTSQIVIVFIGTLWGAAFLGS